MKKRTFAVVATAACLAAGIAFSACAQSVEDIKGEKVTEAQWQAAFLPKNFANLKAEVTIETTSETGTSETGKRLTVTVTAVGAFMHVSGKEEYFNSAVSGVVAPVTAEYYVDNGNTNPVYYIKDTQGKWTRTQETTSEAVTTLSPAVKYATAADMSVYADKYGASSYSDANKGYRYSNNGIFIFKFVDGKLKAFVASLEQFGLEFDNDTTHVTVMYTYGNQYINLPQTD